MKWEKVKISDCAQINPTSINPLKLDFEYINYYDISSVGSGILQDIQKVKTREAPSRARRSVEAGDSIIATVRPENKTYYYFRKCSNQDIVSTGYAVLRPNIDIIDSRFLYYAISSNDYISYLVQNEKGATYPAVDEKIISNGIIPLPPLATQKKIAGILSCYDDLIENCHKQIALLEEAAERLYKKWFIKMEYPGSKRVMGADGVPKGWERKSVFNCLKMYIGGGWGKECVTGKNTVIGQVIRGTDINDIKFGNFANIPIRYHTEDDMKKRSLQANDIIFELSNGNINNIGRTLLIDNFILKGCGKNTICASFCKLLRPIDRIHSILLYLEIQAMQADGRMLLFKKQGSNGINNFAFEAFLSHELLIPNDYLTVLPIENIISKISVLQRQVSLLAEARDLLLPRLMSGEVVV